MAFDPTMLFSRQALPATGAFGSTVDSLARNQMAQQQIANDAINQINALQMHAQQQAEQRRQYNESALRQQQQFAANALMQQQQQAELAKYRTAELGLRQSELGERRNYNTLMQQQYSDSRKMQEQQDVANAWIKGLQSGDLQPEDAETLADSLEYPFLKASVVNAAKSVRGLSRRDDAAVASIVKHLNAQLQPAKDRANAIERQSSWMGLVKEPEDKLMARRNAEIAAAAEPLRMWLLTKAPDIASRVEWDATRNEFTFGPGTSTTQPTPTAPSGAGATAPVATAKTEQPEAPKSLKEYRGESFDWTAADHQAARDRANYLLSLTDQDGNRLHTPQQAGELGRQFVLQQKYAERMQTRNLWTRPNAVQPAQTPMFWR